ncbi:MAG TPA: 1-deoxy-D-xylulose-5-phosphate reductoisomerase [Candidatus Binatia bacterium]|nr:1-deoxy-D-xylulose-5-phosphate reductoisomerase [Candidatus Binatia bacterium]
MKRLAVLGSTGSIGVTTLSVVERFPDRFRVVALAAGKNLERLKEQVRRFQPEVVSIASEADARDLHAHLPGFRGEILCGAEGLVAVATHPEADMVMAALVGAAGLPPTLAAIRTGKTIALANKEALVIAGELMTQEAKRHGVRLLPVDSEHNAIFQALQGHSRERVKRIILTASGGPFLRRPAEELPAVSIAEALQHPTWKMGSKITIDSATLMNKGLEVIEARWLFDLPAEQVAVIIHPQSVVHSMVEYVDGSVLAQLGIPDMAIPISYILAYPDRLPLPHLPALDLAAAAELTFLQPDFGKFPCLGLAYEALARGGTCPAVLNAANEVAVANFLSGQIRFPEIAALNRRVLDAHTTHSVNNLDDLLEADAWARHRAREALGLTRPRAAASA